MSESSTSDELSLRLPLRSEYLTVLRATAGVIAGEVGFNYDEIIQVRVAVSEIFGHATGQPPKTERVGETGQFSARFLPQSMGLEMRFSYPTDESGTLSEESRALLTSLMDVVEIDAGSASVLLVKHRSTAEAG